MSLLIPASGATPGAHEPSHINGGSDEIDAALNIAAIPTVISRAQTPVEAFQKSATGEPFNVVEQVSCNTHDTWQNLWAVPTDTLLEGDATPNAVDGWMLIKLTLSIDIQCYKNSGGDQYVYCGYTINSDVVGDVVQFGSQKDYGNHPDFETKTVDLYLEVGDVIRFWIKETSEGDGRGKNRLITITELGAHGTLLKANFYKHPRVIKAIPAGLTATMSYYGKTVTLAVDDVVPCDPTSFSITGTLTDVTAAGVTCGGEE